MTKDEALKLALEALKVSRDMVVDDKYAPLGWSVSRFDEVLTAGKEALAQPVQEPIARVIDNGTPEGATEWIPFTNRVEPLKTGDLLYGEPPQRTWVGLSAEDRWKIIYATEQDERITVMELVEAKLKEKNT